MGWRSATANEKGNAVYFGGVLGETEQLRRKIGHFVPGYGTGTPVPDPESPERRPANLSEQRLPSDKQAAGDI